MQAKKPDLAGEWVGHYTGHYDEVVKIIQQGDTVEAVKITGDDMEMEMAMMMPGVTNALPKQNVHMKRVK